MTKEQLEELIKELAAAEMVEKSTDGGIKQDPGIGPVTVDVKQIQDAVDSAVAAGLTPLIIDTSEQHIVDTFFGYNAVMVDAKQLSLNVAMKKMTKEAALEKARTQLVAALQGGRTMVVACQQGAPSFNDWFDAPGSWPLGAIMARGGKGYTVDKSPLPEAVMRDEDTARHSGFAVVDPKFATVVTSWFSPGDYEEFLFDEGKGPLGSVGREAFRVIIATNESGE